MHWKFTLLACVALVSTLPAASAPDAQRLGSGYYTPYLAGTLEAFGALDLARWDWLLVEVHDERQVEMLNRLLEVNPRQKYLLRLWPINHVGRPERNFQGTFLDYLYKPGVREEVLLRVGTALAAVREKIARPENVVGYTFLEELPAAWGLGYDLTKRDKVPDSVAVYRAEIEKERGRPLVWDEETWRWLGQQYVRTLDEIHAEMKRGAPGKRVFYWHIVMTRPLDEVPEGKSAWETNVVPYRFADIVKPGLCDGLFAYPNGEKAWQMYLRPCRANRWPFFSQLSHPSFMRLGDWPWTLAAVKTRIPENLGYFFYCEGSCAARNMWNDDPDVPNEARWDQPRFSSILHARRFAAREGIGMDVVRKHLGLSVEVDFPVEGARAGDVRHLCALVRNRKDPSYFTDPGEAIARDVRVRLSLPRGLAADPRQSAPLEVRLGDLAPGAWRTADWWVTITDPVALAEQRIYSVAASSADAAPGRAEAAGPARIPAGMPHEVARQGTSWMEPGYRLRANLRPRVVVEGLGGLVSGFSLSNGRETLTYRGDLSAGTRLVMEPDGKARLFATPLLETTPAAFVDASDASGHRAHDAGYQVGGLPVRLAVQGGARYRVSIAGKAEDGANSLVVFRYRMKEGKTEDQSLLVNRFNAAWREVSQEFQVPETATHLEAAYFYRFQQKGRIWYGKLSLSRAGMPPEGEDVTAHVQGAPPLIEAGTVTTFTFGDPSNPVAIEPVRIQLETEKADAPG